MANIFNMEDSDNIAENIDIDDLYSRRHKRDMAKFNLYKKILNRAHTRIKLTSRQQNLQNNTFCWFEVPEIILGSTDYDNAACIAYLLDTLQTNGFFVKYYHPNLIFISWEQWIPSYVRGEIKKKTGVDINERGEKVVRDPSKNDNGEYNADDYNNGILSSSSVPTADQKPGKSGQKPEKQYTPISSYRPNCIYSQSVLEHTGRKTHST